MKKRVFIAVLMMAGLQGAFAGTGKYLIIAPEVTLSGTNQAAQVVSSAGIAEVPSGSGIGTWGALDYAKVLVPAGETGTVAVAQSVFGAYRDMTTLYVTNATAAAAVFNVEIADIPVTGALELTYAKSGAGTNAWRTIMFFK